MARRPAHPRWFRRPGPLVADSLLAVVVALISLAMVDGGRAVEDGPAPDLSWSLSTPPRDPRPGDVWNAQLVVFRDGTPATPPGKAVPLLTVQNTTTGTWMTAAAKPTGAQGFHRARVVFRDAGEYTYAILLADGLATVAVGKSPQANPGAGEGSTRTSLPGWLACLTLLATLPLALRRRHPLPVLGVTLAAALAADLVYDAFGFLGPLVALYSVGAHVARPTSLIAAAGTAAGLPLLFLGDSGVGSWEMLAIYLAFGAVWLLGDNLRTRRDRAVRLEAERQANVQRAAAEEQARIARELHDIIGHSVSVMTIQAAAAGDAFESRPAQVREALGAIETTGRETLAELRRLLSGVRPDGDSAAFAPAPGLDGLDALVARVRAAGLAVDLTAAGRPDVLPPSVDVSAYRIVQEALTNTLKHAHASKARVDVRQTNGALEIEIVDDGRGASGGQAGRGQGIIGMRERAVLFGGSLSAGPATGGGFAVHARIPLGERVP